MKDYQRNAIQMSKSNKMLTRVMSNLQYLSLINGEFQTLAGKVFDIYLYHLWIGALTMRRRECDGILDRLS